MPRYIWKCVESEKVKQVIQHLQQLIKTEDDYKKEIANLINYWQQNRGTHFRYAFTYILCETLNFVNALGQVFFINVFLSGEFLQYGSEVLAFSEMNDEDRTDPMAVIFPKMTKCTFQEFGYGGDNEKTDYICVLPLNVMSEKVYIFLWFWLLCLAAVSGLVLIYRVLCAIVSPLRRVSITARGGRSRQVNRILNNEKSFSRCQNFGDWFFLNMIVKNLDQRAVSDIIEEICINQTNNDN